MSAVQWAVLALIGFGAALLFGAPVGLGVAAALAVAIAFGLVTSRPIQARLSVSRKTDARLVAAGSAVTVRVRIQAEQSLAFRWLLLREILPPTVRTDSPTGRLVVGARKLATEFIYQIALPHRGVYPVGPVEASFGDMLGLRVERLSAGSADEILVHPRVLLIPALSLSSSRPLGDRRADRFAHEDPTRPAGCRAYVQGDPIKRIHWAASARTGTLVSKVYDPSSNPVHVVVLNQCEADYSEGERFELACTAAASLVAAHVREDDDVGLITAGLLKPDTGPLHLERSLEAIARAALHAKPLSETLLEARLQMPWRSTVVLVTESISPEAGAALHLLRQSGFTIAALLIGDPIESQRSVSVVASLNGSVARIEKEEDIERIRFVGIRG